MRSAPGVWYTGGNYEKIYLLTLITFLTVFIITPVYELSVNKLEISCYFFQILLLFFILFGTFYNFNLAKRDPRLVEMLSVCGSSTTSS